MATPARYSFALYIGLLGSLTMMVVWVGAFLTLDEALNGMVELRTGANSPLLASVCVGGGFVYGMAAGAWLGRKFDYYPTWIFGGGFLSGLTGWAVAWMAPAGPYSVEVLLVIGGSGFLAGFLSRLMPAIACSPDAARFTVARLIVRLMPLALMSLALIALGVFESLRLPWPVVIALGLFGLSFAWALVGQERRLWVLERRLNRLSLQAGLEK